MLTCFSFLYCGTGLVYAGSGAVMGDTRIVVCNVTVLVVVQSQQLQSGHILSAMPNAMTSLQWQQPRLCTASQGSHPLVGLLAALP